MMMKMQKIWILMKNKRLFKIQKEKKKNKKDRKN